MHVLHRPHLPRALSVTAIAAVLAIILTLAIASTLNDVAASPTAASAPTPVAAVHATAARSGASVNPLIRNPFSNPAYLDNGGSHGSDPLGAGR